MLPLGQPRHYTTGPSPPAAAAAAPSAAAAASPYDPDDLAMTIDVPDMPPMEETARKLSLARFGQQYVIHASPPSFDQRVSAWYPIIEARSTHLERALADEVRAISERREIFEIEMELATVGPPQFYLPPGFEKIGEASSAALAQKRTASDAAHDGGDGSAKKAALASASRSVALLPVGGAASPAASAPLTFSIDAPSHNLPQTDMEEEDNHTVVTPPTVMLFVRNLAPDVRPQSLLSVRPSSPALQCLLVWFCAHAHGIDLLVGNQSGGIFQRGCRQCGDEANAGQCPAGG